MDALHLCSFSFVWGGDWAVVWGSQRKLVRRGNGAVVAGCGPTPGPMVDGWEGYGLSLGGNAVAGSLTDKLHVLLVTFAGWFCEWATGGLCDKPGLLFVCSALVESQFRLGR